MIVETSPDGPGGLFSYVVLKNKGWIGVPRGNDDDVVFYGASLESLTVSWDAEDAVVIGFLTGQVMFFRNYWADYDSSGRARAMIGVGLAVRAPDKWRYLYRVEVN